MLNRTGKVKKFIETGDNWKLLFHVFMEDKLKDIGEDNVKRKILEMFQGDPDQKIGLN